MLSQTSNGLINIINNSVIPLNTKNTVKDTEITAKANVIYSQVYFYGNYTIRNNFNESIYNNINTTILQKGIVHSKPLNFKLNSVCNNCKFYCHFEFNSEMTVKIKVNPMYSGKSQGVTEITLKSTGNNIIDFEVPMLINTLIDNITVNVTGNGNGILKNSRFIVLAF